MIPWPWDRNNSRTLIKIYGKIKIESEENYFLKILTTPSFQVFFNIFHLVYNI